MPAQSRVETPQASGLPQNLAAGLVATFAADAMRRNGVKEFTANLRAGQELQLRNRQEDRLTKATIFANEMEQRQMSRLEQNDRDNRALAVRKQEWEEWKGQRDNLADNSFLD